MKRQLPSFAILMMLLGGAAIFTGPTASAKEPVSSCWLRSALPPVFRSTIQPLVSVDTCDDCATRTLDQYFTCRRNGGSDCYCSTAVAVSCLSDNNLCSPCLVCLNWQHQADYACTIGPYVPPRLPGNN